MYIRDLQQQADRLLLQDAHEAKGISLAYLSLYYSRLPSVLLGDNHGLSQNGNVINARPHLNISQRYFDVLEK